MTKWEDFKDKFDESWIPIIKPIFDAGIMDPVYTRLRRDRNRGKIIVPESKNTFKAFQLCERDKTKVVFIGLDPYPWIKDGKYVADGLAFSCGNHLEIQPSLDYIYKAIEEDIKQGFYKSTSLEHWASEGVLLLNSSLTTTKNTVGYYNNDECRLWEPFFKEFLEEFSNTSTGIIYVLFGKQAERYEKYINSLGNYIYKVEHPAAAEHRRKTGGSPEWDHKHIFKTIEGTLEANNKEKVDWIFDNYLPF